MHSKTFLENLNRHKKEIFSVSMIVVFYIVFFFLFPLKWAAAKTSAEWTDTSGKTYQGQYNKDGTFSGTVKDSSGQQTGTFSVSKQERNDAFMKGETLPDYVPGYVKPLEQPKKETPPTPAPKTPKADTSTSGNVSTAVSPPLAVNPAPVKEATPPMSKEAFDKQMKELDDQLKIPTAKEKEMMEKWKKEASGEGEGLPLPKTADKSAKIGDDSAAPAPQEPAPAPELPKPVTETFKGVNNADGSRADVTKATETKPDGTVVITQTEVTISRAVNVEVVNGTTYVSPAIGGPEVGDKTVTVTTNNPNGTKITDVTYSNGHNVVFTDKPNGDKYNIAKDEKGNTISTGSTVKNPDSSVTTTNTSSTHTFVTVDRPDGSHSFTQTSVDGKTTHTSEWGPKNPDGSMSLISSKDVEIREDGTRTIEKNAGGGVKDTSQFKDGSSYSTYKDSKGNETFIKRDESGKIIKKLIKIKDKDGNWELTEFDEDGDATTTYTDANGKPIDASEYGKDAFNAFDKNVQNSGATGGINSRDLQGFGEPTAVAASHDDPACPLG